MILLMSVKCETPFIISLLTVIAYNGFEYIVFHCQLRNTFSVYDETSLISVSTLLYL